MDAQRDLLVHMTKQGEAMIVTCQSVSDRIATEPEVEALLGVGLRVFGNRDRFAAWLLAPNRYLGGIAPLAVLADGDLNPVKDELVRIEHGELIA